MDAFYAGFTVDHRPVRVRFGQGIRLALRDELDAIAASRAIILTTPDQRSSGEELAAHLGASAVAVFARARMHTPVDVTNEAIAEIARTSTDCIVAIGGGSTIGLGKAIALRTGLPQIVLPTTYAGSEATPVLGQTEHGVKTTLSSVKVQPGVILYDSDLVATLPVSLTVASGLNAMAHAVEGLYSNNATRLSTALALDGIRSFVSGLARIVSSPHDLRAREDTLFGAWLCGSVLGQVGMGLHHKLCHTLGGTLDLPHAQTHAVILPHAIAYNEAAAAVALSPLRPILDAESVGCGLFDFAAALGAPMDLKSLGVAERDLDRIAEMATQAPYPNPRPINRQGIRALLQDALEGRRPGKDH